MTVCVCVLAPEKAAFRKKMKSHYKNEFNMAALLKQREAADEDCSDH